MNISASLGSDLQIDDQAEMVAGPDSVDGPVSRYSAVNSEDSGDCPAIKST
jgi:hypothetical protein